MATGPLGFIDGQKDLAVIEGTWKLDEDDWLLYAMLCDPVFCSELLFEEPLNHTHGGCYTVYDYQYPLFRPPSGYAAFPCARSTGKTESIKARSVSHAFKRLGEDLLVTAPELIHLEALTQHIEQRLTDVRLTREFLKRDSQKSGFTHKPFQVDFADGTRIIGRIPKVTGTGVKGMHEPDMIMDESQDYPPKGYTEIHETVEKDHVDSTGKADFTYHLYGVHSGAAGGRFENLAQSGEFAVRAVTALMKPGWNRAEKAAAAAMYGGTHSPDYRRNILGEPGTALSQFFVTARLMSCFLPSTPVATIEGWRPIGDIRVGDEVQNASGTGRVTAVRRTRRSTVAVVRVAGEEFVCSPEHPFFVEGIGWCHADRLQSGMRLVGRDEALRGLRRGASDPTGEVLLKDMCGGVARRNAGQAGHDVAQVRGVWAPLHTVGCGAVLHEGMHGQGNESAAATAQATMPSMSQMVPAGQANHGSVQPGLPRQAGGCDERGAARAAPGGRAHETRGDRRSAGPAIPTGPGARGGLVLRASGHAADPEGRHALPARCGASRGAGGGRGGRACALPGTSTGARQATRSLAASAWVEGVAICERGSDEWARLCGSGDSVELVDLTVAGHPSFAVGRGRLLVHNCLDQDKESHYNTVEFKDIHIMAEDVDKMFGERGDFTSLFELPPNLGPLVFGGMDVGLVNDPTVITLFAVGKDRERRERLRLVRMIHLWRFRERQVREAAYRIDLTYGKTLQAFGQDITGLGLPLLQAMEDDEECPDHLREVSRGYVFNAKVPVGVDKDYVSEVGGRMVDQYGNIVKVERDIYTGKDRYVSEQTMIEASTRYLRNFVDQGFLLLPFHQGIVKDMQGETEQRVRAMGAAHLRKKPNAFHMLDSMRAMAMGYMSGQVEKDVLQRTGQPVLDIAVGGVPGTGGGMELLVP